MKKVAFYILIFFISMNAIGQTKFEYYYSSVITSLYTPNSILFTSDGGYLQGGTWIPNTPRLTYIKTNSLGVVQWSRSYFHTSYYFEGKEVINTLDSCYLITGRAYDSTLTQTYGVAIKTDRNGNVVWSKLFKQFSSSTSFYSVIQLQDSSFVFSGYTSSNLPHPYTMRTDKNGNIIWSKLFEQTATYDGVIYRIRERSNGKIILCGSHHVNMSDDIFLMVIDSSGSVLWKNRYIGVLAYGQTPYFVNTIDNGMLISVETPGDQTMVIKTDSLGNTLWNKTFTGIGHEFNGSISNTSHGGFIIYGETNADSTNNGYDGFMIKCDSLGNPLWTKLYGRDLNDVLFCIEETPDKGLIAAGTFGIIGSYFVKTDSMGNSGCNSISLFPSTTTQVINSSSSTPTSNNFVMGTIIKNLINGTYIVSDSTLCLLTSVKELSANSNISVSPNPFDDRIQLDLGDLLLNEHEKIYVRLFNVTGELLQAIVMDRSQNEIDAHSLKPGFYFLELTTEKGTITKKIVKY